MKGKRFITTGLAAALVLALLAGLALAQEPNATPLTAAFTYQGRLKSDGNPYTGACDFQFGLWDAESGGMQVGATQTIPSVGLADGYFTVVLDWGLDKFQGEARWLDIAVRCPAGGGTYTPLTPRQPLTATPYALFSLSADPLVMQRRVAGTCGSGYAIREVNQDGSVTCEAVGGGGGDAWLLTGNSGTVPGTNFVGTTDDAALVFKVNNERAFRLESTPGSPNVIGGHIANWAYSGVTGAAIGGGGASGYANEVTDDYGTIGGGADNQAGDAAGATNDAAHATVSGGYTNTASAALATVGGGYSNTASGAGATVGGGWGNTASGLYPAVGGGWLNAASGSLSTVGGGESNTASGAYATVSGGTTNTADEENATVAGGASNIANNYGATVGGGYINTASGNLATVSGGQENVASAQAATVGGGYKNTASVVNATVGGGDNNTASGASATVPGGSGNVAQGFNSYAAGRRAKAYADGCFVWGDSTEADVTCDYDDRWVARASGGVYFYTNSSLTTYAYLAPGSGTWASGSDRAMKENVAEVDAQALLARLAQVPVTTWNYTSQDDSIRHIGPMAQDFYAAFGVGEDDTHITTVDADGVALAAIQGLYAENQKLMAQVTGLRQENAALGARLTALEQAVQGGREEQGGSRPPLLWLAAGGLVVAGGALAARQRRVGGRQ